LSTETKFSFTSQCSTPRQGVVSGKREQLCILHKQEVFEGEDAVMLWQTGFCVVW